MTAAAPVEKLLKLKTVSELLDVPEETLRYWRSKGVGPESFTMGRLVVYRESAVAAYVAQCEADDRARRDK